MMLPEKPDASQFRQFLRQLREEPWMTPVQRSWSYYLFHQSNIDNAISIIKSQKIFSRALSLQNDLLRTDSASTSVMDQTEKRWKQFVRLYFRPRNPTFFRIEGFRHPQEYHYNSQCPLPIMFLFDMEKVLCHKESQFSKGSLARKHVATYAKFEQFKQLPFQAIYHEGWFPPEQKEQIVFHRHAEVIFPHELPLPNFLKKICCRSVAEYDTLLFLLGSQLADNWRRFIGIDQHDSLFYKQWLYVENVLLESEKIRVKLSRSPRRLPVKVQISLGDKQLLVELPIDFERDSFQINLKPTLEYTVQILVDGKLAYANSFSKPDEELDLPF